MATPGVVRSRLLRSVCVDVWPCTPGTAPGTARATINTSAEKAPAVHIILQQPKAAVRAQWGRCMPAAQLNEDAARTQAGLGLLQQPLSWLGGPCMWKRLCTKAFRTREADQLISSMNRAMHAMLCAPPVGGSCCGAWSWSLEAVLAADPHRQCHPAMPTASGCLHQA